MAEVDIDKAQEVLAKVKDQSLSVDEALDYFRQSPIEDIGFANLDTHRGLRQGFPEVVFGQGKSTEQITGICLKLSEKERKWLVTRIEKETAMEVMKEIPHSEYHENASCLSLGMPEEPLYPGFIGIITAGTTDIPVACEAAVTAQMMGHKIQLQHDLGVAGIHRILSKQDWIKKAHVLIVVAGMEGALPSVVAGLTDSPVIAVPTSVGYGTHFKGVTALLGMLNSCGSGVMVVNIDNGFGAGFAAAQINKLSKHS